MPELATAAATAPLFEPSTGLIDLAASANTDHHAVEVGLRASLERAMSCGEKLQRMKAQVPHGRWLGFVRDYTDIPARTAQDYMRIAANARRVADFRGGVRAALEMLREAPEAPDPGELDLGEAPSRPAGEEEAPAPPGEPPDHVPRETSGEEEHDTSKGLVHRSPLMSSTTDEWYTPAHVWHAALEALELEAFDLDPCAEHARQVLARQHFTIAHDGLAQEWRGVVWMNPPYSEIAKWVAKLGEECRAERCTDYAALVPARTDTAFWRALTEGACGTVVFIEGRLRFGGSPNPAPFPSALVFGRTDPDAVAAACAGLGRAWRGM